jgi:hypothetical protein
MPEAAAEPMDAPTAAETPPPDQPPAAADEVSELDALLADLQADETPTSDDTSQMDPELAALLASL